MEYHGIGGYLTEILFLREKEEQFCVEGTFLERR